MTAQETQHRDVGDEFIAQVCFYVMTVDTGFAPNPFHGWCTLLGCTPNYIDAQISQGDYIAGIFRSRRPPRLVYIMEVSEKLEYDDYYEDPRFASKKPRRDGTWHERAGNNIYFLDQSGRYAQDRNACFHTNVGKLRQDLEHPVVFAGRNFAYFGESAERDRAPLLPKRFHWCLPGRGVRYLIEESPDYDPFLTWAFSHGRGMIGLPRDREIALDTSKLGKCRPDACDVDATDARNSAQTPGHRPVPDNDIEGGARWAIDEAARRPFQNLQQSKNNIDQTGQ